MPDTVFWKICAAIAKGGLFETVAVQLFNH